MEVVLDKTVFCKKFLNPINKISDRGIFTLKKDGVECLATTSFDKKEQTIILFSKYKGTFDFEHDVESIDLNIPDVSKLLNVFSFLKEDTISLSVNTNNISYKSDSGTSFKYHLLDDGILEAPSIKMENVYKMGFDFECDVYNQSLKDILKGSTFADKTNKIYLYTKDDALYGILTDESLQNVDMIEFKLADEYDGDEIKNKLPINLEIFRVISTLNFDSVKIKVNVDKGIIMFEVKEDDFVLQYIITALVK